MTETLDYLPVLEDLVKKLPAAKRKVSLGSSLDKALQAGMDCQLQIHRLEELSKFTKVLMKYLEESDRALTVDKLAELAQIGQATEQAAEIEQLDEIRFKLRDIVPLAVETVDRRFSSSWQSHIENEFSTLGSLGEVLKEISETANLGKEMATTHQESQVLAKELISAEKQTKKYQALINKRDNLHVRLEQLGADREVVSFLLAVADQEATLIHATSTVQEWLSNHKALGRFRVGL
jgi:hypothetical protein